MIRNAARNDATAIAGVHVRGWQAAYRGSLSDDYLDRLSVTERAERWVAWLADPALPTAVYEAPAGVVGFVSIGRSRDADATAATGEVLSIYVEPTYWRRGVGTELLGWAVAAAPAHGWSRMTLWTLASNAGARAFYERCGWSLEGVTKHEPLAGRTLAQVRYARSVAG